MHGLPVQVWRRTVHSRQGKTRSGPAVASPLPTALPQTPSSTFSSTPSASGTRSAAEKYVLTR